MTDHAALRARYLQLRQVGLALNNKLVATLAKDVLHEGGKQLGILKNNTLVFDSEDQMAVLIDYCLHDVRRGGMNTIDRFLAEAPPPAGSDEMLMLKAKQRAWYSLFQVTAIEPGLGVHVQDLLRDEPQLIVDIGFSQTAPPGFVIAARFMIVDGIGMTTGTGLPLGEFTPGKKGQFLGVLATLIKGADPRNLPPEVASTLTAAIIGTCLRGGAARHVEYRDPAAQMGSRRASVPAARLAPARSAPARHVGRNDPCPCGSGRKFKHCCGGRR